MTTPSQVASGAIVASAASLLVTHPELRDRQWPLSRSGLYRIAKGYMPSTSKLIALLTEVDKLGVDPYYQGTQPLPVPPDRRYNLFDNIADALNGWLQDVEPQPAGPNPLLTDALDLWVPILTTCRDSYGRLLIERIQYPLHPVYPSHTQLHELGVWEKGVSPYQYLVATPKHVLGLATALRTLHSDRLKHGDATFNPLTVYSSSVKAGSSSASASTLYAMKRQAIGTDFLPNAELAEAAANVAALSMGATDNHVWDLAMREVRISQPPEVQRFGLFDISTLAELFKTRLLRSPTPCTIRATFTPTLKGMYDTSMEEIRQYAASGKTYGEPDPQLMGDLLVSSIASQLTLKWTPSQLLAIALFYHVPLHALLLWLLEAGIVYRRQFITHNSIDQVVSDIVSLSPGIDPGVYRSRFIDPYKMAMKAVTPSAERRYNTMKAFSVDLLKAQALANPDVASDVPMDMLRAFYEALLGCTNQFATDPTRPYTATVDPNSPTALYSGNTEDEDDDEPAISLMDVLDEEDDKDDYFIPAPSSSSKVTMPSAPAPVVTSVPSVAEEQGAEGE